MLRENGKKGRTTYGIDTRRDDMHRPFYAGATLHVRHYDTLLADFPNIAPAIDLARIELEGFMRT